MTFIGTYLIASFEHQDFTVRSEKDGDHILDFFLLCLLCVGQNLNLHENFAVDAEKKGDYYLSTLVPVVQSENSTNPQSAYSIVHRESAGSQEN
jgi:hypothetical protein